MSVEGTAAKHTTNDHNDTTAMISTETRDFGSAASTVTADLSQMDFSKFQGSTSNKTDRNHPGSGRGRGGISHKVSGGQVSNGLVDFKGIFLLFVDAGSSR